MSSWLYQKRDGEVAVLHLSVETCCCICAFEKRVIASAREGTNFSSIFCQNDKKLFSLSKHLINASKTFGCGGIPKP